RPPTRATCWCGTGCGRATLSRVTGPTPCSGTALPCCPPACGPGTVSGPRAGADAPARPTDAGAKEGLTVRQARTRLDHPGMLSRDDVYRIFWAGPGRRGVSAAGAFRCGLCGLPLLGG